MREALNTLLLLLSIVGTANAQKPTYYNADTAKNAMHIPFGQGHTGAYNKCLQIITPQEFGRGVGAQNKVPDAPTTINIGAIYLRCDQPGETIDVKDVTIRLLDTDLNTLPGDRNSFVEGMHTASLRKNFKLTADAQKGWIRFELDNPYEHQLDKALLVEITCNSKATLSVYAGNHPEVRRVCGVMNGSETTQDKHVFDFGFDVAETKPQQNQNNSTLTTGTYAKDEVIIKLYPNPATNMVYLTNVPADATIDIVGINGRVLAKGRPYQNSVDISNYMPGYYMLHVRDAQGKHVGSKSFLKAE